MSATPKHTGRAGARVHANVPCAAVGQSYTYTTISSVDVVVRPSRGADTRPELRGEEARGPTLGGEDTGGVCVEKGNSCRFDFVVRDGETGQMKVIKAVCRSLELRREGSNGWWCRRRVIRVIVAIPAGRGRGGGQRRSGFRRKRRWSWSWRRHGLGSLSLQAQTRLPSLSVLHQAGIGYK